MTENNSTTLDTAKVFVDYLANLGSVAHPVGRAGKLLNEAVWQVPNATTNGTLSVAIDGDSPAKVTIEVTVGIGAGVACGVFASPSLNPYFIAGITTACSQVGSYIAGEYYDGIASMLGYDNKDDYLSNVVNEYPQSSFEIAQILQNNNKILL